MRAATLDLKRQDEVASSKPADFNRLARVYRWLEWLSFGPILWKCRCQFLAEMNNRRAALVIGDGDGRFTAQLLKVNPHIAVDAVDASEAMLNELMKRAGCNANRVHARLADARKLLPPPRKFDLIASHFFLDCLTTREVESLAAFLHKSMAPGAVWVVSEFAVPESRYGRLIAAPLVTTLYRAFGLLTGLAVRRLPDHRKALRVAGFVLTQQHKRLAGLLVSELWQLDPLADPLSAS